MKRLGGGGASLSASKASPGPAGASSDAHSACMGCTAAGMDRLVVAECWLPAASSLEVVACG